LKLKFFLRSQDFISVINCLYTKSSEIIAIVICQEKLVFGWTGRYLIWRNTRNKAILPVVWISSVVYTILKLNNRFSRKKTQKFQSFAKFNTNKTPLKKTLLESSRK